MINLNDLLDLQTNIILKNIFGVCPIEFICLIMFYKMCEKYDKESLKKVLKI